MKRYLVQLYFICLIILLGCSSNESSYSDNNQMTKPYISISQTYEDQEGKVNIEYYLYDINKNSVEKTVEIPEHTKGTMDLSNNVVYFSKKLEEGEQLFSYDFNHNKITQLTNDLQEIYDIVSAEEYIYLLGVRSHEVDEDGICTPEIQPMYINKNTKEISYYHKYDHNTRAQKLWYDLKNQKIYIAFFDNKVDKLAREFERGKEERSSEDKDLRVSAYEFSPRIIAEFDHGFENRKDVIYLDDDNIEIDYMKDKNNDILILPRGEVHEFSKNDNIILIKIGSLYDDHSIQYNLVDLQAKEFMKLDINNLPVRNIRDLCLDPAENKFYFIGTKDDGYQYVLCHDIDKNSTYNIFSEEDRYKLEIKDIKLIYR